MFNPRRFNRTLSDPCTVSRVYTSITDFSSKVTREIVGECNPFTRERTNVRECYFTCTLEYSSFIGIKGTVCCRKRVVLGHCPDVSENEVRFNEWFTIEITVTRPSDCT